MKLTILVDNFCGRQDLKAEHGLSYWLETGNENVLIDTGQGETILHNAPRLGIDLKQTGHIVLSHGHYDHTSMLGQILMHAGNVPVWAHPEVGCSHTRYKNDKPFFIGCHVNKESLDFRPVQGKTAITEKVWALEIPMDKRDPEFFTPPEHLRLPSGDGWKRDIFEDDISFVVEGEKGLSVILGCAHAGVVNILEETARHFQTRDFYSVIGGMHIGDKSREYASKIVETMLDRFSAQLWVPCHCTGFLAAAELYKRDQNVVPGKTGMSVLL